MGKNGREGLDMKKILITLLVFVAVNFSTAQNVIEKALEEKARVLLSKNYLEKLDQDINGNFENAVAAVFEALKYIESYSRINKNKFYEYFEQINTDKLPEDLAFSLDVANTLISTSTVAALKKISENTPGIFSDAVALRIFFYDWKETKDPPSAKKALKLAQDLEEYFPKAYYIFHVFLEYHSTSSFKDTEIFMEYREKALKLNLDSDILNEIIHGDYRLGEYEKVISDFKMLKEPNELSKFFHAYSYYVSGEYGTAELRFKDTNLSEIPGRYASQAYDALGQIAEEEGNIDSAIFYYRKSLESNPNNTDAMIHLGFAYLESDANNKKTMARYYLEMSGMEDYRKDVKETLDRLRRELVFSVIFKRLLPIAAIIVVALILLEYFFKRKRTREEKEALEKDKD